MNNKYFKVIISLFLVGLSLLIFSCSRCKNKTFPSLSLSSSDLLLIPYVGNEKLVFADSLNDSIVLLGEGKFLTKDQHYIYDDCRSDYEAETYACIFHDSINTDLLQLRLGFGGDTRTYESITKNFFIGIFPSNGIGEFSGVCFFNNDSIFPSPQVSFKQNIQIGAQTYSYVYVLISGVSPPEKESITFVYYSVQEGIIAWKTNKRHLWIIKK
jgi:hypothetical protein